MLGNDFSAKQQLELVVGLPCKRLSSFDVTLCIQEAAEVFAFILGLVTRSSSNSILLSLCVVDLKVVGNELAGNFGSDV